MLKTAYLMAVLLLLSSVTIANTAIAESLRDIVGSVVVTEVSPEGKIFALTNVRMTRPDFFGGDPLVDTEGVGGAIFAPKDTILSVWDRMSREIQTLPSPSGVAALTYTRDPETGKLVPTSQGLGAIHGDRAQTLGRGKLNFGIEWSYINYDGLETESLRRFPIPSTPFQGLAFVGRDDDPPEGNRKNRTLVIVHSGTGSFPGGDGSFPGDDYQKDERFSLDAFDPDDPGFFFPEDGMDFNLLADYEGDVPALCLSITEPDVCSGDDIGTGIYEGNFTFHAFGPEGDYTVEFTPSTETKLNIHLDINLVNFYLAYGITDTVDVGVIVPYMKANLDVDLDYRQPTTTEEDLPDCVAGGVECLYEQWAEFVVSRYYRQSEFNGTGPVQPPIGIQDSGLISDLGINQRGLFREDASGSGLGTMPLVSLVTSGKTDGFGDVVVRGKWNFLQSRVIDLAGRLDLRFPTGSKKNFRGTDEFIATPTLIASKTLDWFSGHANVGLDVSPGDSDYTLLRWAVGADVRVHPRASLSVTWVGSKFLNAGNLDDTAMAVAPGVKLRLWGNLIVKGSALLRVADERLNASVIPSLGIEYVFF